MKTFELDPSQLAQIIEAINSSNTTGITQFEYLIQFFIFFGVFMAFIHGYSVGDRRD